MNNKVKSILDDAWLNIDVTDESQLFNPLDFSREDFHLKLTWLMMQPEYFYFVCKEILNVELLPVQALMLQEKNLCKHRLG